MTLKGELPQWPLLQLVLVVEKHNGEVFETLLVANGLSKVLKDCVYNRRRRAHELVTNVDILRKFFLLSDPLLDSVYGVLYEALVHLYPVQLDSAIVDVLRTLRNDFSLVGQERERDFVDAESKCVCHNIIENRDLPLSFAILQLDRKHTLLRKFFPSYELFGFIQADL